MPFRLSSLRLCFRGWNSCKNVVLSFPSFLRIQWSVKCRDACTVTEECEVLLLVICFFLILNSVYAIDLTNKQASSCKAVRSSVREETLGLGIMEILSTYAGEVALVFYGLVIAWVWYVLSVSDGLR